MTIVEVGPRDGLQNIKNHPSFDQKRKLIQDLLDCGFSQIEAGSFVRPDKVPSMADTPQIADHFKKEKNRLWYLVPNLKGCEAALAHGVVNLAFFTAASETFNQKNIGMSTEASLAEIKKSLQFLAENKVNLRLYISTVISCPYEGKIKPEASIKIMEELMPLGFSQVSLGDTIGVGTPDDWKNFMDALDPAHLKGDRAAMHCHDTYGRALSCIDVGLDRGIRTFDSSVGGLGGCPFAPGAPGNLATESLAAFLHAKGLKTGVDLDKLKKIKLPFQTAS
ncbi:MAG: hydroxymethylglutaryl-CoA lyase [Deltaproteobacteria bacterium]|nr:hydroxymethylglutaryl-CoA lyase [Deltaproteobacteria bacterium]